MLKGFGLQLAQDGAGAAAARRGPEWARRIMERSARGELMPLASMEAAEKVLGINRKEQACR